MHPQVSWRDTVVGLLSAVALLASPIVAGAEPDPVTAENMELLVEVPYEGGTHIEIARKVVDGEERLLVLAGARSGEAGLRIFDVTDDPEDPVLVSAVGCVQRPNDIAVVDMTGRGLVIDEPFVPAGREVETLVGIGTDGGACRVDDRLGGAVGLIDATDIENPIWLGLPADLRRALHKGAHTIEAHPTEPLIYLANQNLADRAPTLEILDLAVWPPELIVVDLPPTGVGPHEINFNADGTRAYLASVNVTLIIDTTNPRAPNGSSPVGIILDPTITIHHEAVPHPNGRHLLITDEVAGAAAGPQCPGGGVHVYDLLNEATPVKVGAFFANDLRTMPLMHETMGILQPPCTAHEFNISPDGAWMPIGWYGGGVRVFDLSDVNEAAMSPAPRPVVVPEIGHLVAPDTSVWVAKTDAAHPGYIYANDEIRGLQVLRYTGADHQI